MMLAQQLYEGMDLGKEGTVGLITYMRTDSTRISDTAKAEAAEFIEKEFGKQFVNSTRAEKKQGRTLKMPMKPSVQHQLCTIHVILKITYQEISLDYTNLFLKGF